MEKLTERIISGGQIGVDRAALDVAIGLGIPCGGWCPKGRRAEDGADSGLLPPAGGLFERVPAADSAEPIQLFNLKYPSD
jgi:hypothetical protein